jgi:hypothetical protein
MSAYLHKAAGKPAQPNNSAVPKQRSEPIGVLPCLSTTGFNKSI